MTAITGELSTFFDDPFAWVWEKIEYAVQVSAAALAIGFALLYTWNPFASAFSFLRPLGGFWSCTLAALGILVAMSVYQAARDGKVTDTSSDEAQEHATELAIHLVILGLLAYLVVTFLQ